MKSWQIKFEKNGHTGVTPMGAIEPAELPVAAFYGYSVYTTFQASIPDFLLQDHWERLRHDAAVLNIPMCEELSLITGMINFSENKNRIVRLTLFPEVEHFSDIVSLPEKKMFEGSRLLVSMREVQDISKAAQPLSLQLQRYDKWMPTIKHGGALFEDFERRRLAVGYDDVLRCNHQGNIAEATTSNFFGIREGILYTPEAERDGCLPGVTRKQVLKAAAKLGFRLSEEPVSIESLKILEGAFLTNAVSGMRKIGLIEFQGEACHIPWSESASADFNRLSDLYLKSD